MGKTEPGSMSRAAGTTILNKAGLIGEAMFEQTCQSRRVKNKYKESMV